MSKKKKVKSYKFGLQSERVVSWFLRLKGYHIVAHRYKTPVGEIDLVARRGKTLILIEVKARSKVDYEVVHKGQQQRITRAASLFIAKNREFVNLTVRFDVVLVVPWKLPVHIKNAW